MKRMRSGMTLAMAVIASATLLAACGTSASPEGSSDTSAAGTSAADASTPATSAAGEQTTAASEAAPAGEPGPAEDADVTVAIPFPDINMYAMYEVATAEGYYKDEGLTVKVITADNVAAAVSSGSADIGVESAGAVIEAMRNGVKVGILAGHFARQNFDFAVQPGITKVEQLDGKAVALAGTSGDPAEFQRALALKQAGWDLSTVNVDIVYPGPDSSTWVEFFTHDRIALTPFYGDDRPALEAYGANIVLESLQNWANDFHIAGSDWLKANPNTAVRFLRATMKASQFIVAPEAGKVPENRDKIFDIMTKADFADSVETLRGQTDNPWILDGHLLVPNLYVDKAAWDETIATQELEPLEFDKYVDLSYLLQAQKLMGLDNAPPATLSYP